MLKLQCNGDLECLDEEDEEDYQGSVNSLGVIKQKIPDLSEPGVPHRGLKLQKRFTNLSWDSSRCRGEKEILCIK